MWNRIIPTILLICLVAQPARAEKLVVVSDDWEGFTEAGGTGYYFEMMRAVYEPAGHTLEFKVVPYTRALKMVENQQADLMAAIDIADLPPSLVATNLAVGMDGKDAFVRPGELPSLTHVAQLQDLRVIARRGYAFDQFLPKGTHYSEFSNLSGMLKMLEAGRADVILDYEEDMNKSVKDTNSKIRFDVRRHVLESTLFMGFSNSRNGALARKVFSERFTLLIAELERSTPPSRTGVLADLARKYSVAERDMPRRWHVDNATPPP